MFRVYTYRVITIDADGSEAVHFTIGSRDEAEMRAREIKQGIPHNGTPSIRVIVRAEREI